MRCQRRILRISWRQFVRNSEISALTGLSAINDVIRHRASPSLATSPDCRTAPQHIKPYSLTSTSHSVVFPIPPGVVGLVAHVADGSTNSETTPARHLPTSGDRPLDAVIMDIMDERRDGPRWLCDDDDDDEMPNIARNSLVFSLKNKIKTVLLHQKFFIAIRTISRFTSCRVKAGENIQSV